MRIPLSLPESFKLAQNPMTLGNKWNRYTEVKSMRLEPAELPEASRFERECGIALCTMA
jgi:hypothetical protein